MILNAAQLCELLSGELVGDGSREIYGPSQIEAGGPGTVSFLANPKYEPFVYTTTASVLIVSRDFVPREPVQASLIRVDNVYGSMMMLLDRFSRNGTPAPGISPTAILQEDVITGREVSIGAYSILEKKVKIGDRCVIYPQVFIGHDVVIGEDVILYPGVRIYPRTVIGDRCIIHANAVIGCDGFGYQPDAKGRYVKIPHVGKVILEQDVEIGANVVIDRATIEATRIEEGVKIDNLVQVAHNVVIGKHTVIAAQAGIAGSTSVGKYSRIGGQVGIAGHIHLADKLEIQAQSGVHTGKHPEGAKLFGYPAIGYKEYLKSYIGFTQLPDIMRRMAELERELAELKKDKS